jgi:hypothetical protein
MQTSLLLLALVIGAASAGPLESAKVCDASGSRCPIPQDSRGLFSPLPPPFVVSTLRANHAILPRVRHNSNGESLGQCPELITPRITLSPTPILCASPLDALDENPADSVSRIGQGDEEFWSSDPFYPSPWMNPEADGWEDAYKQAKSFVSQLTLLEKVNLTTGVG